MHIYRLTRTEGDSAPYFESTLANAHAMLKDQYRGLPDARIELLDVKTDKENLVEAFNCMSNDRLRGTHKSWFEGPLRTWALTPRGGLKQVANGE